VYIGIYRSIPSQPPCSLRESSRDERESNCMSCSNRYYTNSHRATKRYDGELRGDTKRLELAVNGIYRLGLLQAIRGAGGRTDRRVAQSSAEALFAIRAECPRISRLILKTHQMINKTDGSMQSFTKCSLTQESF